MTPNMSSWFSSDVPKDSLCHSHTVPGSSLEEEEDSDDDYRQLDISYFSTYDAVCVCTCARVFIFGADKNKSSVEK